jgi:DNA polymerase elongation subunit (family B)
MSEFYTNVSLLGNNILYRGVSNGERVKKKIEYKPSLFVKTNKPTDYKTLQDEPVERIQFESISDANRFIRETKDISNLSFFGNTKFIYAFIADYHKEQKIDYDFKYINTAYIDIEVDTANGYASPENPWQKITAITMLINGCYFVFGLNRYKNTRNNVKFIFCESEEDLLKKFIELWRSKEIDIVSGWNIQFFDLPYLVNRIIRVLDEKTASKLSPWRQIGIRQVIHKGKKQDVVELIGIAVLDYYELYRKFQPKQESEKLNYIAYVELNEHKLSYDEYGSLHNLYHENYQKFIDYNIKDVELVYRLEEKLKLIEMSINIAYDAKTNYTDVFTQVRLWDSIIFNYFKQHNLVLPQHEHKNKLEKYAGAYVKDVIPGMYDWIVSFDIDSLYPHLIVQFNISPETITGTFVSDTFKYIEERDEYNVDDLLNKKIDTKFLNEKDETLAVNGFTFSKEKRGFLPDILNRMIEDRKLYKKKLAEAKRELEETLKILQIRPDDINLKNKVKQLEFDVSKYNNFQLTKKIQLNSAYGAMGTNYFRFYDTRLAEAVTLSGQLAIKWIAKDVDLYLSSLMKDNKNRIVAIDTDSIYITLGDLIKQLKLDSNDKIVDVLDQFSENKIKPVISKSAFALSEYLNCYSQSINMKREVIANKGVWTAKKRYMLNTYDIEGIRKKKLKIMGIEAVRSSTPEICRRYITEATQLIFDTDEATLQKFISEKKEEFRTLNPADVAFPRGMNGLVKYTDEVELFKGGTPIHVRGALLYNHFVNSKGLDKILPLIRDGDKIKFMYLREPNPVQSHVIAVPETGLPQELNLHKYVDYDKQFEKAFLEPMQHILAAINWKAEQETSLEYFFG